ncbi:MAG: Flp pilus assembly protein CpaB [Lachnospiraceae bacterium]
MKGFLKNRIVLGLVCILAALVICFGLTPMFNDALKSKVTIVRVNEEIKKGEQITSKKLSSVEVGGYNLPGNVVLNGDEIIGKYANTDLYKGDYVLQSKVSDTPMLKNEYLSKLNGENRAISISIKSFAAGLSGKLESGDIISLIGNDVGDRRETLILPELQYVEIIAVTGSSGADSNIQDTENDEDAELASTITVLVNTDQARLLAELERNGSVHAALVYRGTREQAQLFLDEQTRVLEELSAEAVEPEDGISETRAEDTESEYGEETGDGA